MAQTCDVCVVTVIIFLLCHVTKFTVILTVGSPPHHTLNYISQSLNKSPGSCPTVFDTSVYCTVTVLQYCVLRVSFLIKVLQFTARVNICITFFRPSSALGASTTIFSHDFTLFSALMVLISLALSCPRPSALGTTASG